MIQHGTSCPLPVRALRAGQETSIMRKTIALASAAAFGAAIAGGLACTSPVDHENGEGGYHAGSDWGCHFPQWKAGQHYHKGDIVTYNGQAYIATHDNPGYIPTVSTYFWSPYKGKCGT